MKKDERDQARHLRSEGMSISEIVSALGVAKSSVSLWVRDVALTTEQRSGLSERGRSVASIELRRQSRLTNERARRRVHFDSAASQVEEITEENLFFLGCALYWGEGAKTNRSRVDFTNSDPRAIQVMMRFFREICDVPTSRFRGHIILHPHLNVSEAEDYWSGISGISPQQFYRTSMQQSKASQSKKDSLPYGTFSISVNDTELYLRVMGWLEGIYTGLIPENEYLSCKFHQFL